MANKVKKSASLENLKKPKRKHSGDDYIQVSKSEDWLNRHYSRDFYDDDFRNILELFVVHSPCEDSNYTPYTLESLGWKNPWKSSTFREYFMSVAGFDEKSLVLVEYKMDFITTWNASVYSESNFYDVENEFAIITCCGEKNKYMAVLHHVRNCFAHGRYSVVKRNGESFIYFEDVSKECGILAVTARMCLKKSTLTSWYKLFTRKDDRADSLKSIIIAQHT